MIMLQQASGTFRIAIPGSLKVRYAPETGPSRDRLLNYRFRPKADIPNARIYPDYVTYQAIR